MKLSNSGLQKPLKFYQIFISRKILMSVKKMLNVNLSIKKIDENKKDSLSCSTCKHWSPDTALASNEVIIQPYASALD